VIGLVWLIYTSSLVYLLVRLAVAGAKAIHWRATRKIMFLADGSVLYYSEQTPTTYKVIEPPTQRTLAESIARQRYLEQCINSAVNSTK